MPAASRALSKALSGVEPSAVPAVPAALVTGAKRILSSLLGALCAETTAPSHERRPTAARREFLAHRSGSAEERKQKVDFGAARWSRGEPAASARGRGGAGQNTIFFLQWKKYGPTVRKIRQVENFSAERSGEEGKSASTGATPAARAVRLRRRGHQQSGHREGVHGGSGEARSGHHRRRGLSRVQPVRHQRSRRHRRVAPGDSHMAGVPLRRGRRLLLRRCPPAPGGRGLPRGGSSGPSGRPWWSSSAASS